VRLFTALWPPAPAVAALAAQTAQAPPGGSPAGTGSSAVPRGWQAVAPAAWHITLAFHGEADPGVLARRLDAAARGAPAPRLRLRGAGAAPGVRWVGVQAEPEEELTALVEAAGGDVVRFVPHVTVIRMRRRPGPGADLDPHLPWSDHRGPWWHPPEVLLVSSEPARGGARYRVVHRVQLRRP